MSNPSSSSTPLVDHGPEVLTEPWPRADDPKQVYVDTPAESSPHLLKAENGYGSPAPYHTPNSQRGSFTGGKVLFGLGILGWSGLLVVLTAIIIGAAVGGGVGSALSSCNSDKSSLNEKLASCTAAAVNTSGGDAGSPSLSISIVTATVTVSSSSASGTSFLAPVDLSNFTAVDPATISDVYTGCPAINKKTYTSTRSDVYTIYCDADSGFGSPSLEDKDLTIQVFAGFVSYTLDDCMEACSSFNKFSARNNIPEMQCRSVTFNHKMSKSLVDNDFVNCWIKNGTLAESSLSANGDTVSCMMRD